MEKARRSKCCFSNVVARQAKTLTTGDVGGQRAVQQSTVDVVELCTACTGEQSHRACSRYRAIKELLLLFVVMIMC